MRKNGKHSKKNMDDNHDFYLKTDVMLLSDVFENYRDLDLKHTMLHGI